ncbi:DNA primase [Gracilibacillus oryzae]|uniref:DNA primase n=1 Tax=Gracilibacillus oryzae TaxID=1672701 RepID=A0A7C8GS90_9BACI|nr:DNA primase [Gracilibacillus oryzae]KAB8128604.1 DNA primase [Gracilibacillus oryzae]
MANQYHLDDDTIATIQSSNDIVDVVGDYVQLKKQGRNYFGLCPFHSENTPSFSVNQEKQIFHCFGCGKGGNVYTFLMELEGFSFPQSVQHLAEKSGHKLEIPQFDSDNEGRSTTEEQLILEAYQWLAKLYHHLLYHTKDGKKGLEYLHQRGFSDDAIEKFQIGFSPQSRDFIVKFLEKKGYHRQLMVKAGFLTTNDQINYFDRFRGRIIFPIRNAIGKTVGFGGRSIDNQEPKYLNSPESELFQKSKLLYNFDNARSEIRKRNEVILLEGYADVLALYQAGVMNAVASLGTSFTDSHANILRRYVETVVICFDGDTAGQNATYKTLKLLKKVGCNVKIAMLPNGYDPDQYIQEFGAEAFRHTILDTSASEMTFLISHLKKNYNLNQEGDRLRYVENIISEIALLDSSIKRDHYLRELSEQFSLSYEALQQDLAVKMQNSKKNDDNSKKFGNTNEGIRNIYQKKQKVLPAYHKAERQLIAFMLQNAHIAERVQETLGSKFNIEQHQIIVTHLYGFYEAGNQPNPSHFLTFIEDQAIQKLVVEISIIDCNWEISDRELDDYIYTILAEQNDKSQIRQLEREQKMVEKTDPVKAAQIAMEIIKLRQESKRGS